MSWTIVFCSSGQYPFTLLREGFQHVLAVRKMCDGHLWQVIDPNMSFLDVMLLGVSDYPDIRDIVDRDYIAIECPINDNGRINSVLGYNTCVDTIKRLLGIKKFSIQTPYQLYKYLDKHYGR